MNVKKRKVAHVTPKKKDTELPCPEVAKEITEWLDEDVVWSLPPLGEEVSPMCPVQTVTHVSGRSHDGSIGFTLLTYQNPT